MSKLWTALPTADPGDLPRPAGVCWWRRLLPMGPQGHHMIIQTYAGDGGDVARLGYWEWFDGHHHTLVYGHDVFDVRFESRGGVTYLDLLAPPMPIFNDEPWASLTSPDEEDQRYPFAPSGFGFRDAPVLPYRYAPHIAGNLSPITGQLDARRVD